MHALSICLLLSMSEHKLLFGKYKKEEARYVVLEEEEIYRRKIWVLFWHTYTRVEFYVYIRVRKILIKLSIVIVDIH